MEYDRMLNALLGDEGFWLLASTPQGGDLVAKVTKPHRPEMVRKKKSMLGRFKKKKDNKKSKNIVLKFQIIILKE